MTVDLPIPGPETVPAEQVFLGALLLLKAPEHVRPLSRLLQPDDLWRPAHRLILATIADLAEQGLHADQMSVMLEMRRRGTLDRADGAAYLLTLAELCPTAVLAPQMARQIAATVERRRALESVTRAANRLVDLDQSPAIVMTTLMDEVETLTAAHAPAQEPSPAEPIDRFLARDTGFDWIVPGLLERGDRLIVTGSEGAGKSTFTQQLAVCLAAGRHPFAKRAVAPLNVTIVDCENGARHLRRKLGEMVVKVRRQGWNPANLRIESRPSGLDLTKTEDSSWLMDLAVASQPDLLVIGPLYRLYAGAVKDEECARAVTVTLDAVRSRVNCSLLMEAHSPHGETGGKRPLRPSGSSLWMRWPEFGYGLRLSKQGGVELEPWRGPRDERQWPEALARGTAANDLPWLAADRDYLAGLDDLPEGHAA